MANQLESAIIFSQIFPIKRRNVDKVLSYIITL